MSSNLSNLNPLNYVGTSATNPPQQYRKSRAPLSTDVQNFNLGDEWLDSSTAEWWKLCSNAQSVADWNRMTFSGSDTIEFLPDSGTSPVVPDSNDQITITGSGGVTVVGGTNTLTISGGGAGFDWNMVTTTSQTLVASNAYVANNASLITFTLPSTASFGDVFLVTGYGAGGWKIAQNALQSIKMGALTSTVGITGSLASTIASNTVIIVCLVANTTFKVIDSMGNITVV